MGDPIKRNQIKRNQETRNKEWLVMGVFFLILRIAQLFLQLNWGDDVWFAEENRPLGEYLSVRYNEWTSRLIIETGLKLLAPAPHWIWRVLNALIVLLLVWMVADLFGVKKNNTKLQSEITFFALIWAVPMVCVGEVGWITTTLNYLWPLTLGVVAARPIKHWAKGEGCPVWEYIVCPLCMIFGANVEQGAALLLGVYLLAGACILKKERKLPVFYFVQLLLATASIVFILTTPGNADRIWQGIEEVFPEFANMSVLDKLLMGFIDTASYYLAAGGKGRHNYLFALLAGILLAGIWQKRKEKRFPIKAAIAFLPFLFCWGIGRVGAYWQLNKGFRYIGDIIGVLGLNRCLPMGAGTSGYLGWIPYSMNLVLFQAGVYLALLVCVILTIYFLHGKTYETLFELVILGAGLLSRLIVGFSPSFYISGERTALYCNVAVLIVCLRNLQFFWNGPARKWERAALAVYFLGIVGINLWL